MCLFIFSTLPSTKVQFYLVLRERFGRILENFVNYSEFELELGNDNSDLIIMLYKKNSKAKLINI